MAIPGGIMRVTTFVAALSVVGSMGCGAPDEQQKPAVGQVSEPLLTAPDCLSPNTPKYTAYAQHHANNNFPGYLTSYTARFPATSWTDNTIHGYEEQVWSIPRTNGYMYQVAATFGDQNQTSYVFLVGIRDRNASPPYLMQPPTNLSCGTDWPFIRCAQAPAPFAATDNDYTTESNLSTQPAFMMRPVAAKLLTCVTVVDEGGNVIDYFPLADTHDPSVGPW
jgi:hypothetical protein